MLTGAAAGAGAAVVPRPEQGPGRARVHPRPADPPVRADRREHDPRSGRHRPHRLAKATAFAPTTRSSSSAPGSGTRSTTTTARAAVSACTNARTARSRWCPSRPERPRPLARGPRSAGGGTCGPAPGAPVHVIMGACGLSRRRSSARRWPPGMQPGDARTDRVHQPDALVTRDERRDGPDRPVAAARVMSVWQSPDASIRTVICPGPGSGMGRSSMTSGRSNC